MEKRRELFTVLKAIKINWLFLVVPLVLSAIAALLEGLSAITLIPLTKGIVNMDFDFVFNNKYLGVVFSYCPYFIKKNSLNIFILLASCFLIALVLKNICQYTAVLVVSKHVRQYAHHLRMNIMRRYLSFGKMFFDKASMGSIMQVLIGFSLSVPNVLSNVNSIFYSSMLLTVYFFLMIKISWQLTLIVAVAAAVILGLQHLIICQIKRTSEWQGEIWIDFSRKTGNIFSSIPLIKSYSSEEKELRRFGDSSEQSWRVEYSLDKKSSLMIPLQEVVLAVFLFVILLGMALMVIVYKTDVSYYVAYLYMLKRSASSLGTISGFFGSVASIKGPVGKLASVLDDEGKYMIPDGVKPFGGITDRISLRGLTFSYDGQRIILEKVSTDICKGKVTAIVGPTGSGKTTIINLLMRFYDCCPGQVYMDGTDIRDFKISTLMGHIAYVGQDPQLFNDTLRNNLVYGLSTSPQESFLKDILAKSRLWDFVVSLPNGLETLVGDRGVQLSGGEKQRVSIARALLKDAKIIIMDEATSAMDSSTERMIQEAIDATIKDRTAIIVAHRLATIKNSDKIIVLENGSIVEEGGLSELLSRKGRFYDYWQQQKFF